MYHETEPEQADPSEPMGSVATQSLGPDALRRPQSVQHAETMT